MNIRKLIMGAALAITLSLVATPSANAQHFGITLGGHRGGISIGVGHGHSYGGYYGGHRYGWGYGGHGYRARSRWYGGHYYRPRRYRGHRGWHW